MAWSPDQSPVRNEKSVSSNLTPDNSWMTGQSGHVGPVVLGAPAVETTDPYVARHDAEGFSPVKTVPADRSR